MDTSIKITERKHVSGFTLIELMVVMLIMAIMMGIAMVGFSDWARGTGMQGASMNVKSSIALARQWAITHRKKTTFLCTDDYYVISCGVDNVGGTNYLPEGLEFEAGLDFTFRLDGSCTGNTLPRELVIKESDKETNYLQTVIQVYPITGRARVKK